MQVSLSPRVNTEGLMLHLGDLWIFNLAIFVGLANWPPGWPDDRRSREEMLNPEINNLNYFTAYL